MCFFLNYALRVFDELYYSVFRKLKLESLFVLAENCNTFTGFLSSSRGGGRAKGPCHSAGHVGMYTLGL